MRDPVGPERAIGGPDYEGLGDYIKLDGGDWSEYTDWDGYDNS